MIPALAFAWLSSTGVALPQPPAAPPKPAPPAKNAPAPKPAPPKKLERPVVTIETPKGVVKVELFPIDAPRNVANILALVDRKFYDGLVFHRIEDWVAQGGDPNGDGTGGPGYNVPNERNRALKHVRGAVGMANSGRDTAGSQFYILKKEAPGLDNGNYTLIGMVIAGMDVVDKLAPGDVSTKVTSELPEKYKPAPFGPTRSAEPSDRHIAELPTDLKRRTFNRSVRVKVSVPLDGNATPVLMKGSGDTDIDDAVLAALRRWKWTPALRDGQPVASIVVFDYDIVLGYRQLIP